MVFYHGAFHWLRDTVDRHVLRRMVLHRIHILAMDCLLGVGEARTAMTYSA